MLFRSIHGSLAQGKNHCRKYFIDDCDGLYNASMNLLSVISDILVTLHISSEKAIETAKLLALKESLLIWYLLKKSCNSSQEIFTFQFLLGIIVRVLLLQVFIILRFYADCGAAAAAIKLSLREENDGKLVVVSLSAFFQFL